MKKLMMVMGLCSVLVFGADMQTTSIATTMDLSNATKMNFVETKPTQFTLNIPIDIDPIDAGIPLKDDETKTTTGKQTLQCTLSDSANTIEATYQNIDIEKTGSYTLTVKFNNIPEYMAVKYDRYGCIVFYKNTKHSAIPAHYNIAFDTIVYTVNGTLE